MKIKRVLLRYQRIQKEFIRKNMKYYKMYHWDKDLDFLMVIELALEITI